MICQSGCRILCALIILIIAVECKPPPTPSPWAVYGTGKSIYSKPIGPPNGLDTITVPYGPKVSPFFPKLVDPKAMISSKTDYLSNLFGGIGPANYPYATPVLYASSNIEDEPTNDISELESIISNDKETKRSMFGPSSGKFSSGPSFGPFGPKFTPGFNFPFVGDVSKFDTSSRRKRSILTTKPVGPSSYDPPPPPYPGLSTITEESENDTPISSTDGDTPKQFLPGLFGPFGPFGFAPTSPIIEPSIFTSKKATFLNTLFSNLATSTPATSTDIPIAKSTIVPSNYWSPIETATAIPIPKSTIVPADFWLPSSIIPSPGEYTDKLTTFLNKLVENIKLNKITSNDTSPGDISSTSKINYARSLISDTIDKTKITNSIDDIETISAVKDAIVDSIISELGSLKTDMINNLDELILAEQLEAAKTSSSSASGKKPLNPFKAAFGGLWGSPPTTDPSLPFKQKMSTLSEVFDMLTELQKNITDAVTDAIKNHATVTDIPSTYQISPEKYNNYMPISSNAIGPLNISFWDAIKNKLTDVDKPTTNLVAGKYSPPALPYWSAYSQSDTVKRHVNNENYDLYNDNQYENDNKNDIKRDVKMSMHQGYRNMPSGTIESIQAGGGSIPGHQGGGIKFTIQMPKSNVPDYK